MTFRIKPSYILGARLLLANAALLVPLPTHAATGLTPQSATSASNEALVRIAENSTTRFKSRQKNNALVQQQPTANQNSGAGTLSNGQTQHPQLGSAGEEVRKYLDTLDLGCGKPGSVC